MGLSTSEVRDTGRELPDAGGFTAAGEARAERADEGLHYGRAWHRFRFCYRAGTPLRVLDAGCGTGHTTSWLAKLNPGARVLGVDPSPATLDRARRKTHAAGVSPRSLFCNTISPSPFPVIGGRLISSSAAARSVARPTPPGYWPISPRCSIPRDCCWSRFLPARGGRSPTRCDRPSMPSRRRTHRPTSGSAWRARCIGRSCPTTRSGPISMRSARGPRPAISNASSPVVWTIATIGRCAMPPP